MVVVEQIMVDTLQVMPQTVDLVEVEEVPVSVIMDQEHQDKVTAAVDLVVLKVLVVAVVLEKLVVLTVQELVVMDYKMIIAQEVMFTTLVVELEEKILVDQM